MMLVLPMLLLAPTLHSTPMLGIPEGRCRLNELGPAILVIPVGLRDRTGSLKLELYPANDRDFLADDNILISQGKVFRRVVERVPAAGPVQICIRIPKPGTYSLSLLHDRDSNRKFSLSADGIGFPGNPKLGWSKPGAAGATIAAGPGLTTTRIVMNYRHGMFGFGPMRMDHR
jgi:uncharacterized protein (DUF2141 family)